MRARVPSLSMLFFLFPSVFKCLIIYSSRFPMLCYFSGLSALFSILCPVPHFSGSLSDVLSPSLFSPFFSTRECSTEKGEDRQNKRERRRKDRNQFARAIPNRRPVVSLEEKGVGSILAGKRRRPYSRQRPLLSALLVRLPRCFPFFIQCCTRGLST